MKKPFISAILNFFFMGAGYIYNGKRVLLGILFTLGAIGLTYVEFQIKEIDMFLYVAMFISIFVVNTAFAIDGFKEAKNINETK
ncbi:MAG: hypothetical protein PF485_02365 [Bacteroidales bacterium]|jgi:hypothetical protein|nr:hypothetical protein [Bacteroidales bacterium]